MLHNDTAFGCNSYLIPFPSAKRRNRKKKKGKLGIADEVSLQLERQMARNRVVKYYDSDALNVASLLSVANILVTNIPQGVAQQQRIADTVFVHALDIRMNISTANSDVFNCARFLWFIWWQNTASVTPNPNSIVENASTYGIYSHYNFEGREYFSLLRDCVFNMTGTVTNPTANSQHVYTMHIPLSEHRIDFNTGVTNGTGHIFNQNYSDSSVAPWPVYNLVVRTWFSDD